MVTKKPNVFADLRLLLAWLFITMPCCVAGYAYEAGTRAFRRGRRLLDEDIHDL